MDIWKITEGNCIADRKFTSRYNI